MTARVVSKGIFYDMDDVINCVNIITKKDELTDKMVGYVGNSLVDIDVTIREKNTKILKIKNRYVDASKLKPFKTYSSDDYYALFLPADKVTGIDFKQKKYRPFTSYKEFHDTTGVGILDGMLTLRSDNNNIMKLVVLGISLDINDNETGLIIATSSCGLHNFEFLFNHYTYQPKDCNYWLPFGIEITKESE